MAQGIFSWQCVNGHVLSCFLGTLSGMHVVPDVVVPTCLGSGLALVTAREYLVTFKSDLHCTQGVPRLHPGATNVAFREHQCCIQAMVVLYSWESHCGARWFCKQGARVV